MKHLIAAALVLASSSAFAWGRHGHSIVGETAAALAGQENAGLKSHSYDIGYYCNVPDFIWKRPATYETEKPQHFMDLEIFHAAFAKKPEVKEPFNLSRKDFEATFPDVKADAGRAYWRIREMAADLEKIAVQLRALPEGAPQKERHALQAKWLVLAGTLGHYVGDLSMPLHVSENYDGQLTGQKGIHAYFEDTCVDELFSRLQAQVSARAVKAWPEFRKKNADKSILQMLEALAAESTAQSKTLLAIDKKSARENVAKTCAKYDAMITQRLASSGLVLAEIYRRSLGWKFDDNRFYFFAGEPEYIRPGEAPAEKAP